MTDVGSADLSRLLQSKRNECSSIVTSRKRKLRELFAVATHVDSLPHEVLANPDAPTSTPTEWQFLQANDIFQGKIFNERSIPPRPKLSLEILKKSLANSVFIAPETLPPAPQVEGQKVEAPISQDEVSTKGAVPATAPVDVGVLPVNATTNNVSNAVSSRTATPNTLKPPSPPEATASNNVPNAISTRTATPNTLRPSPQPDALPQTLANEVAKPVEAPKTADSTPIDESTSQTVAPTSEAQDASVEVPRKQAQVTFSAGTKGSPSEDVTMEDTEVSAEVPPSGQPPSDESDESEKESKTPPFESANDTTRVPDAVSSPESTAQSATTPAPQDISTDTSPDNEGNLLYDRNREKREESADEEEGESTKASVLQTAEDLQKQVLEAPPDSAEAQLLQESIRSNDRVGSSVAETSFSAAEPVAEETSAQPPELDHVDAKPSTEEDVQEEVSSKEATEAAISKAGDMSEEVKEIPDSQEEAPDQMDIDEPQPTSDAQTQSAKPLENTTSISQDAPTTAQTVPKETQQQAPERAVTRVASGAMKLKSVSEIVGESPRPTPTTERTTTKRSVEEQLTPRTSTPKSPGLRQRRLSAHRRDRSKGQVSTVVFGKKPKHVEDKSLVSGHREPLQATDDYYTPLFVQGFAGSSSWMQPLEKILFTANKTVATPDANLAIQDHQACKVLRRVYHLQQHDKWSLRQPKRCPEPVRPPSHWDVMLKEMKWMRTDFREERKWKMATARNLAYACLEWHESTPEERKLLQVPAVIPPKFDPTTDVSMADVEAEGPENQPTPDLISSADVDSVDNVDELREEFVETIAPSAIFSLQDDEVVFGLRRSAAADKLLDELPMYGGPLTVPKFDLTGPEYDPDAHWRRPALPLSKYVEGHMKLVSDGPPRKRSRYSYQNEDSEDEDEAMFGDDQSTQSVKVPPQTAEVALFNPEMKHIRDRLHAGHQFRPPSEHPMPTQSFYESRSSSQWTLAEDDELRLLVKDYAYNWSLISSLLSTKSLFMSGAERRTPWECFERWINLEGLPADMQKTQYFKAYNSRIEAAQRVIMQQNQIAAQQASQAGGQVTPVRRRPSTPLRVERRRNQKHLAIIDAMRKLAKKRETTIQKQQHSASQNANNKNKNDPVSQRPTKTPRDYSLLRWERDQALAEKMAAYAQRQEASRRAALQVRAQGQPGQMTGNAAPPQAGQNAGHPNPAAAAAAVVAAANGMNGVSRVPNMVAAAAVAAAAAGQGRPRMPMQAPANGMAGMPSQMTGGLVPPAQMTGVPQAQMQAMQGQQHRMPMPNPQPDVNLMMQAQRISNQQRMQQLQQAQQQQGGPGTPGSAVSNQQSPPPNMRNGVNGINGVGVNGTNGVNGMAQQNFMHNAQAMMASFNAANNTGHSSPPANGLHMPAGPAGSPGAAPRPGLSAALMNQLNALEASYRAKNPNLTPEQHRQMATEHLTRVMLAQRQNAMNAAAGGNGQPGLASSIAATTSPHQYAALLRQQQQQQANQAAGNTATQHQRQASGSATPGPGK